MRVSCSEKHAKVASRVIDGVKSEEQRREVQFGETKKCFAQERTHAGWRGARSSVEVGERM